MWHTMLCVDNLEDLWVQGSLLSPTARAPEISVDRCIDPVDVEIEDKKCKADNEIDDLINNAVVLYIWNTQTYNPADYGDGTI